PLSGASAPVCGTGVCLSGGRDGAVGRGARLSSWVLSGGVVALVQSGVFARRRRTAQWDSRSGSTGAAPGGEPGAAGGDRHFGRQGGELVCGRRGRTDQGG